MVFEIFNDGEIVSISALKKLMMMKEYDRR